MSEKSSQRALVINQRRQGYSLQRWIRAFAIGSLIVLLTCVAQFGTLAAVADSSATAESSVVYLPASMSGYFDGALKDGISGRVLVKGQPAANIPLGLRFFDGSRWSQIATTQSDGFGNYNFSGVAALAPGQQYYVSYGPNETNPAHVYYWYGPIIETYAGSGRIYGGIFDIADVPLIAPPPGTEAALPILFEWNKRQLAGETYRMVVLDQDDDIFWRTFDLGDVGKFTLNVLAPDMIYNEQYAWYVEVYMGPDSFGESYMLNNVKFLLPPPVAQSARDRLPANPFLVGSGRGGR